MDTFAALAEPTRRNILLALAKSGPLPATAIYHKFRLSHPGISQHLKVLKQAGLVRMRKQAQQHVYELNRPKVQEIKRWLDKLRLSHSGPKTAKTSDKKH
jgi:DNA-binding transcriptional ArsR family regulator